MTPRDWILEIEDLLVYYENALAINNLTLRAERGGITGVFGTNGAGKSTLMKTVSGLIVHQRKQEEMRGGERIAWFGRIRFDGEDLIHTRPSRRARKGIVLCPERRRVFSESSAMENLKIGGYLATRSQARKTLDYVFATFPVLADLKRRPAGFLSGGEQQMLAIGRALMAQPSLLLLDEPLLGLAPLVEVHLAQALTDINRSLGLSIMVTEQYARPLLPVVGHCYVLENGGTVFEGTTNAFRDNPDVMAAYFGGM